MSYLDDYDARRGAHHVVNERMSSKRSHPFAITCRNCGSNAVKVVAYEHNDLWIECCHCGKSINCGTYYTFQGDYSEC